MNMESMEQQIIKAAIECIEKYGLSGVTNRRIAEIANINHAAINYYFRSKENLITKVMELTVKVVFNPDFFDPQPGVTAKHRCISIFEKMVKGGCDYPEIMRAHFYGLMNQNNGDLKILDPYKSFMIWLCKDLSDRGTKLTQEELQLALTQIASACFMVVLVPNLNIPDFEIDLRNEEKRHVFVSRLVEKLIA